MEQRPRITLEPVTPEWATMLLEDPVQLEVALCVAYDGPAIDGEFAQRLRSLRDSPDPHSNSPTLWFVRIRSEDTIIGWVTTESTISVTVSDTSPTAETARMKFELSPAYQNVGYEWEITQLASDISNDPPKE